MIWYLLRRGCGSHISPIQCYWSDFQVIWKPDLILGLPMIQWWNIKSNAIAQPQQLTKDLSLQKGCIEKFDAKQKLGVTLCWWYLILFPWDECNCSRKFDLNLLSVNLNISLLTRPNNMFFFSEALDATKNCRRDFFIRTDCSLASETNVFQRCLASTINTSHFSLLLLLSTYYGWMWVSHQKIQNISTSDFWGKKQYHRCM